MDILLKLIDALRSVFGDISIRVVLEVIEHVFKIGPPPDLDDKEALRHWLQGLLPALDTLAEMTPNDLDNKAAYLLRAVLTDAEAWNAFYALLLGWWRGETARHAAEGQIITENTGIDWTTILKIIEMIAKIIDALDDTQGD